MQESRKAPAFAASLAALLISYSFAWKVISGLTRAGNFPSGRSAGAMMWGKLSQLSGSPAARPWVLGGWPKTRQGTESRHRRLALPDPGTSPRERTLGIRSSLPLLKA